MSAKQSLMITWVDNIVGDYFIHDVELLFRARILASAWLLFSALFFAFSIVPIVLPLKPDAKLYGITLCLVMGAVLAGFVFRFKHSGNYRLYANLSLAFAFSALSLSVFLASSPKHSPTIGLFYVVPVLATFFLGRLSGLVWSAACIFMYALFMLLDELGVPFAGVFDQAFHSEVTASSYLLGFIGVLGLVFSYEVSNKHLREARDLEYQRYEFLAEHDALTKLANRNTFDSRLAQLIGQIDQRKNGEILALLYFDLDGFKPINDRFGHKAGDEVLKVVAVRVKDILRDDDMLARVGGDEFIILLKDVDAQVSVTNIAEKILARIAEPIDISDALNHSHEVNVLDSKMAKSRGLTLVSGGKDTKKVGVSASIGIALYPDHSEDIEQLKILADKAMYRAKKKKNAWFMHSSERAKA